MNVPLLYNELYDRGFLMFDELHEECGVFGCYQVPDAARITYYGLHSLQHRGQEASGIAAEADGQITVLKGKGLTVDVFRKPDLEDLSGTNAVGHVRYSTAGGSESANIQPIVSHSRLGDVAVVHNGQIVNEKELRRMLEEKGAIFQGTSDSEVILHLIRMEEGTLEERVRKAAARLEGAFAVIVEGEGKLFAFRDVNGLRPLSVARKQDGWMVSSETCAFEVMGIYDSETVPAGGFYVFDRGVIRRSRYRPAKDQHVCAMEYIYFARPDSVIEDVNVHKFRKETGRILAREDDVQADVVIGVPDSSLSAAIGYSEQSGLPFETGLVKNRYVGRTFIQPTQEMRDRGVRMKLSPVKEAIQGKSVIMIDDSIVRGTTSRRIVRLLKEAGAREVHVRIASPVITHPCFYGVDTSTKEELIGHRMDVEEIRKYIEADSLQFMTCAQLREAARDTGLCTACFDGDYCTELFSYGQVLSN